MLVRAVKYFLWMPRSVFVQIPGMLQFREAKAIQLDLPRAAAASNLVSVLEGFMRDEQVLPLASLQEQPGTAWLPCE